MNIAAPSRATTDSRPAADRQRVPLTKTTTVSDSTSASLLGRVLPSTDRQRVEVAAFQSSI